ncbi:MAG: hypothetical protein KDB96_01815 [Flavobacteriales bacterium]|nr:hypothetical protein [Flavobacteriales bacterium]
MIIKRRLNLVRVLQYDRGELPLALISGVTAWIVYRYFNGFSLPFSVAATLGGALAIFIGFRNNSAYGRWWEARKLWGAIINDSRNLGRLVLSLMDGPPGSTILDNAKIDRFERRAVRYVIAWVNALRLHLRRQEDEGLLDLHLPEEVRADVARAHHKPNIIILLLSREVHRAQADGLLDEWGVNKLDARMNALVDSQGGCERIKNTPLPRQYHYFTRVFLMAFILLLPFCLAHELEHKGILWAVVPLSFLISFVFAVIGKVGEVNEDPFEGKVTDIPISALCNTIERDLLEMLEEEQLPAKLQPVDGYLD